MSVVGLGSVVEGDGTFGVDSANLMNFISVRANEWLCESVDSFDVLVVVFLLFFPLLRRYCITCIGLGCFRSESIPVMLIFIARDCNPWLFGLSSPSIDSMPW